MEEPQILMAAGTNSNPACLGCIYCVACIPCLPIELLSGIVGAGTNVIFD